MRQWRRGRSALAVRPRGAMACSQANAVADGITLVGSICTYVAVAQSSARTGTRACAAARTEPPTRVRSGTDGEEEGSRGEYVR